MVPYFRLIFFQIFPYPLPHPPHELKPFPSSLYLAHDASATDFLPNTTNIGTMLEHLQSLNLRLW